MKSSIIFIFSQLLISQIVVAQSMEEEAPEISQEQFDVNIKNSIPQGWIVRDTASGDLNKDGQIDIAIVIQDDNSAYYKTENDGFGYDSINLNKRLLLVFFKTESGYELIKKVDNVIPEHEMPTINDPYGGISIMNGILETGYGYWANAGSWYTFRTTYKFRFQNDDFFLIGIEHNSMHRGSMELKEISVNFSTRKAHFKVIIPDGEDDKITSEWRTFEMNKLYKLSEVVPCTVKVLDEYL